MINLFDWAALTPIAGFTPTFANFDFSGLTTSLNIDFSRFNATGAIVLTPEPSRVLLLLLGLLGFGLRRRRKSSF